MRAKEFISEIGRRDFLKGAAVGAASLGMASMMPSAPITLSPFDERVQRFVFRLVAEQPELAWMKIDRNRPTPKVVVGPSNKYDYINDIIYLSQNAKADNLAHEYVHYLQELYARPTELDRTGDDMERVAVLVQHKVAALLHKNKLLKSLAV